MQAVSPTRRIAEINITPLIDIVLVLLIVFIVMVPMADRAHNAVLPTITGLAKIDEPPPTVVLDSDGRCILDGRVVAADELMTGIRDHVKLQPIDQRRVILKVSENLPMQRVTEVMDMLKVAADAAEQEMRKEPTYAKAKFEPMKLAVLAHTELHSKD